MWENNHSPLLKLLANEENHNLLIIASDDLMDTTPTNMPTIRAAAKGESRNRLLPRTLRELKYQLISKCSLLLQNIALSYNILAKDLN